MKIAIYYFLGAILALCLGIVSPSFYFTILFIWISAALVAVAMAYLLQKPKMFRKSHQGRLPLISKMLFYPYFFGAQVYNGYARKRDTVPAIQQINDNLFLACRLFPSDLMHLKKMGVSAIIDATAEFDALHVSVDSSEISYLNVPILDHQWPQAMEVKAAIYWIENQIRRDKKVVVHCALGRGRSVLLLAAYLLSKSPDKNPDEILQGIAQTRPTANLNQHQYHALVTMYENQELQNAERLAIIANPVSGTKNWMQAKDETLELLFQHYIVDYQETTKEIGGDKLAEKVIANGINRILVCGGDGTVAEVAQAAIGKEVQLTIAPCGTANALAHLLYGVQSKVIPIQSAINALLNGNTTKIDVARCNGELMLLIFAIGFEQRMIEYADRDKKNHLGQLAYLQGFWQAISDNEKHSAQFSFDEGVSKEITFGSFVAANAAPSTTLLAQGGGLPDFQDGKLDITVIDSTENAEAQFQTLGQLLLSSEPDHDGFQHFTCRTLTITGNDTIHYVIDGEPRKADKISIEVLPEALILSSLAN